MRIRVDKRTPDLKIKEIKGMLQVKVAYHDAYFVSLFYELCVLDIPITILVHLSNNLAKVFFQNTF